MFGIGIIGLWADTPINVTPPPSGNIITTEAGDLLSTEAGDQLVTE